MAIFGKEKAKKPAAKPSQGGSMQDLYQGSEAKPAKTAKSSSRPASGAAHVLVRPLVTEKATNLTAVGKYAFVISAGANKISVARAIEAAYGVKPVAVNIMNMEGKKVSRGRISGQRSDWRKAIVTLKKGEAIKIYEGV